MGEPAQEAQHGAQGHADVRPGERLPVHVRAMRFFDRHVWAFDGLFIALPLTIVEALVAAALYAGPFPAHPLPPWPDVTNPLRLAVVVAICAIQALRRVWPVPIAWTVTGLALASVALMAAPDPHYLSIPITVYTVAAYTNRRWSLVFGAVAYLGALCVGLWFTVTTWNLLSRPDQPADRASSILMIVIIVVLCAAIVTVAWLLGDLRHRRRAQAQALAERAELLERERSHEARLAADAERLRIAREMHDVVSHSMSVMIAQSDGGRFVATLDPARAQEAFRTIGDTGRGALAQMRQMLGVLRSADADDTNAPLPDVSDLPELVGDVRATGVRVDLLADLDALPDLTSGAGLAVFRIVQEALTNTLKHAGSGAHATVRLALDRAEDALLIRVDDSGPTAASDAEASARVGKAPATGLSAVAHEDGRGSGLRGMDERARLYNGTVTHAADASGFHVTALLPLASIERIRA